MLARENRLLKAEHFRSTMRSGRKVAADHLVIYLKRDEAQPHARFGFVVAKTIGGAVKRNLVKRRMRAIAREILTGQVPVGASKIDGLSPINLSGSNESVHPASKFDVVVRALPGAAEIEWNKLREEFSTAFIKAAGNGAR